jgi:hypothetical protein
MIGVADDGSLYLQIATALLPKREASAVLNRLRAVFQQALGDIKATESVNTYLVRHQALTFARHEFASAVTRERDLRHKHQLALDKNEGVAKLEQEIVHERGLQEKLSIRESHLSQSIPGAFAAAKNAWGMKAGALLRQERERVTAELAALEAKMFVVPLGDLLVPILD